MQGVIDLGLSDHVLKFFTSKKLKLKSHEQNEIVTMSNIIE